MNVAMIEGVRVSAPYPPTVIMASNFLPTLCFFDSCGAYSIEVKACLKCKIILSKQHLWTKYILVVKFGKMI